MSTHRVDVSGARALTTTINDPAATVATVPAKQGDDLLITAGGTREFRLGLPQNTRIQRRRYVTRQMKKDASGDYVRVDGEYQSEEKEHDEWILILPGSFVAFGRCSFLPDEEQPQYMSHSSSTVSAKQWKEPHHLESGVLVEELTVKDWRDGALEVEVTKQDENTVDESVARRMVELQKQG